MKRNHARLLAIVSVVVAIYALDSSVRFACAYALGMANLPMDQAAGKVRWHYATFLWSIGNTLGTSDPRQVYVMCIGERWPGTVEDFACQGFGTRRSVLQILIDALATETCPRTRYRIMQSIGALEDVALLVETYKHIFETDTWTIPEGHFGEGVNPMRGDVIQIMANRAVKRGDQAWLDALRWAMGRCPPWESSGYEFMVTACEKLGWIDRAFIQSSLVPFLRPEICQGNFPVGSYWVEAILKAVRKEMSDEEAAPLFLQVARAVTANADRQVQSGVIAATACLYLSKGLSTAGEICKVLLVHPDGDMRDETLDVIIRDGRKELVNALVEAYHAEPHPDVFEKIRSALQALAPDVLASLPPKRFPTWEEQLHGLLLNGQISREMYELEMLDLKLEKGEITAEEYEARYKLLVGADEDKQKD